MHRSDRPFLTVTDAGETAPWLTLIHGMVGDHRVFDKQVEAFKDRYRLLLVDLPGHGFAAEVTGPFGHLEMMAHVRRVLDQAEVRSSHVWATHTGTSVAILLAIREPKRFKSLILEGAVLAGHPMPYISQTLAAASALARSAGVRAAVEDIFSTAGWFDVIRAHPVECRAEAHWRILDNFSGAPWLFEGASEPVHITDDELKGIQIPTLIYNGELDLDDFIDVADRIERLMPQAVREIIPGGGGFPAWEFPDETNAIVRRFLDMQV